MKKNEALEGLRGLACIAVVSCHFFYIAFPYLARVRDPGFAVVKPGAYWQVIATLPPVNLLFNGDFAVILFFVLSGYVLTSKFWRISDRRLLVVAALKRYPRLIIPASASVLIALTLMSLGYMRTQVIPEGMAGWVPSHYVHVPDVRAAFYAAFVGVPFIGDSTALAWNGPLWTMRLELLGSLGLFAVLFIVGHRKVAAFLCFAAGALYFDEPVYFLPFIIGSVLNGSEAWLQRHARFSLYIFVLGILLGSVSFMPVFDGLRSLIPVYRTDFYTICIWYVIGAGCMLAGVLGSPVISKALSGSMCVYLGRVSFSMYLLHWPVIFSLGISTVRILRDNGVGYQTASWAAYLLTMLVIIAGSHIFYRFVDIPSIRFSGNLTDALTRWRRGTAINPKNSTHSGDTVPP